MMGLFGMLGAGLMTFVLRETVSDYVWLRLARLIRMACWGLNVGLAMMVVLSLFPRGVMQVRNVSENGYWHARSLAYTATHVGMVANAGCSRVSPRECLATGCSHGVTLRRGKKQADSTEAVSESVAYRDR